MAWKIVFIYNDGGKLTIRGNQKKLPMDMAKRYLKEYTRPSNDKGNVYLSPFKSCIPIPLAQYEE